MFVFGNATNFTDLNRVFCLSFLETIPYQGPAKSVFV